MLIAVDHGNKQIKTNHRTFTAGFFESNTRPPFGKDVLFYNNKYYTLSDQRIPYMRDKTSDDRYFILTLFAIGFELKEHSYSTGEVADIELGIGLPPAHFGTQYEKFTNYFLDRGIVEFSLDDNPIAIKIINASCFPQAYAATMPIFQQIRNYPKAIIVDIGGFTADYMIMKNGIPTLSSCDSLENGVINLYNNIRSIISSNFDLLLEESDIDDILKDEPNVYDKKVADIVREQAKLFVNDLINRLRELMIDLRTGKAIFVGGGSILLKKYIETSDKISCPIFVEEISANTKGYELLYKAQR